MLFFSLVKDINKFKNTEHQFFPYKTIIEQEEKGKTFDEIVEFFNRKGFLSFRGKKFKENHIHSIVKRMRLTEEKLQGDYQICNLSF